MDVATARGAAKLQVLGSFQMRARESLRYRPAVTVRNTIFLRAVKNYIGDNIAAQEIAFGMETPVGVDFVVFALMLARIAFKEAQEVAEWAEYVARYYARNDTAIARATERVLDAADQRALCDALGAPLTVQPRAAAADVKPRAAHPAVMDESTACAIRAFGDDMFEHWMSSRLRKRRKRLAEQSGGAATTTTGTVAVVSTRATGLRCVVLRHGNAVYVTFRGTAPIEGLSNVIADGRVFLRPLKRISAAAGTDFHANFESAPLVHAGVVSMLSDKSAYVNGDDDDDDEMSASHASTGMRGGDDGKEARHTRGMTAFDRIVASIRVALSAFENPDNARVVFLGHSLGGALAQACAVGYVATATPSARAPICCAISSFNVFAHQTAVDISQAILDGRLLAIDVATMGDVASAYPAQLFQKLYNPTRPPFHHGACVLRYAYRHEDYADSTPKPSVQWHIAPSCGTRNTLAIIENRVWMLRHLHLRVLGVEMEEDGMQRVLAKVYRWYAKRARKKRVLRAAQAVAAASSSTGGSPTN